MAGRYVHYIYSVPVNPADPKSGKIYVEDEHYCCRPDDVINVAKPNTKAKYVNMGGPIRVFRADETRAVDLVQFWSREGGRRTIEVNQILGAYAKPHLGKQA